jgi:DNA modification methylase
VCSLFERNNILEQDKQKKQLSIFKLLESNLIFSSARSFENQVHFQQAHLTPVQRWFPYREGYSMRLVTAFLNELNITGNVFDPFSGSGTTLLASRHKNLQSFGVDVNPVSTLVASVENEQYNQDDIREIETEKEKINRLRKSTEIYEHSFDLADKMFNNEILQSLLQIKALIKNIKNPKIQNLFFVAWLSIIEKVSNIKKEGNGIKYKNRRRTLSGYLNIPKEEWETKHFPNDKFLFVKNYLLQKIELYLSDIKDNYGLADKKPKVYNNDCLLFNNLFPDEVQFTFFSPPYCNCFDYFEIHKVELWLGDFVKDKEKFKKLRETGFRSNTNSLNNKPINYHNENLENLISLFDKNNLWSNKIPSVVRGYFDDTHTLLEKLHLQTQKGGYVGIVIGNSAYSGVIIPSDILTAKIAEDVGFNVENIFITRHLTTSPQQKKDLEPLKEYLRESIVLLKK